MRPWGAAPPRAAAIDLVMIRTRGILGALLTLALAAPLADATTVTEFPTPIKGSHPFGLAVADDGSVWYGAGRNLVDTDGGQPHVGRLDPVTQQVQTFPLATAEGAPNSFVRGAGGILWALVFSEESTPELVRIDTTTRAIEEIPIPRDDAIDTLAAGPQGQVYGLIDQGLAEVPDRIVAIGPGAQDRRTVYSTEAYPYSPAPTMTFTAHEMLSDLSVTRDGVLWTTARRLGLPDQDPEWALRIDPATGAAQHFPLPTGGLYARIAAGPGDEAFAMTGKGGAAMTLAHVRAADGSTSFLTFPPFGAFAVIGDAAWTTDGPALRRIDPATGASTTTRALTFGWLGFSIVAGPNGEIWSPQNESGNLIRITLDEGTSTANADAAARSGLLAPVDCAAACSGSASVEVTSAGAGASAAAAHSRRIGRTTFKLRHGGHHDARIRLTRSGRALLKHRRAWRATIRVRTRIGKHTKASTRRIVLRYYPSQRLKK
jgi:streptogramin lyase